MHKFTIQLKISTNVNKKDTQKKILKKRHKVNKSKIGQERRWVTTDYHVIVPLDPWLQESVSMHKSPTPVRHSRMNQARSVMRKKGGRETRKTDRRTDKISESSLEFRNHLSCKTCMVSERYCRFRFTDGIFTEMLRRYTFRLSDETSTNYYSETRVEAC